MITQVDARDARPVERGAVRLAASVAGAALLLAAATIALDVLDAGVEVPPDAQVDRGWLAALTGLAQVLPGALLLRRLPRHAVAWVLVVSGLLWIVDGLASSWAVHGLYAAPGAVGTSAAYWFYLRFGATLLLALPVLLLVFPDGRLPGRPAARRLAVASLAATALLPVVLAVVPFAAAQRFNEVATAPELRTLDLDPISIDLPDEVWAAVLPVAYGLVPLSMVVPVAAVVARYRRARGAARQQLRWLVWAGVVDLLAVAIGWNLPDPGGIVALTIAVAVTSAAIVVAVTRHRLYDIDELLSATVVYGLFAALVVVVDLAVVAVAGAVLGERDSALLALGVVALLYAPLRDRVWTGVRRVVRGSRDDPYGTVAALAERLELAEDPDQQLRAVARSVAEAFRLPWVRVEIERPAGERAHVEHGRPTGPPVELPVLYRGERIGRVLLCSSGRAGLSELSARDQRLLGDLVRQAAAAARTSELSASLQRIRERLVLAREEERRRLRRDLHDSLGPGLGAVTLRIETARNLAATAPEEADRMLERATAEVAAALADVRRLVHDLRPPALDELGLLHAVRQQAAALSTDALAITVTGDEVLADLPAAVEVAAYRIAAEAMTNAVRHSGARHCAVSIGVGSADASPRVRSAGPASVEVVVRDDGTGIGPDVVAGVGTLSLRERAGELGGTCTVTCPPGGGTEVRAVLPVEAPA